MRPGVVIVSRTSEPIPELPSDLPFMYVRFISVRMQALLLPNYVSP
jgi:hypothetical protein